MVEVLLLIFMAHMLGLGYWLKKKKHLQKLNRWYIGMRLPKSTETRIEGILHYKLFK